MSETQNPAVPNSPELTVRSIIVGLVVALIIGSAYPYCVLKLGFGPNLSVVSAFFGRPPCSSSTSTRDATC